MKKDQIYCVAIFDSVSHVIKAEKILKKASIPHKIIPVPKNISTDCGVCVRFLPEHRDAVTDALMSSVSVSEIRELFYE